MYNCYRYERERKYSSKAIIYLKYINFEYEPFSRIYSRQFNRVQCACFLNCALSIRIITILEEHEGTSNEKKKKKKVGIQC